MRRERPLRYKYAGPAWCGCTNQGWEEVERRSTTAAFAGGERMGGCQPRGASTCPARHRSYTTVCRTATATPRPLRRPTVITIHMCRECLSSGTNMRLVNGFSIRTSPLHNCLVAYVSGFRSHIKPLRCNVTRSVQFQTPYLFTVIIHWVMNVAQKDTNARTR